MRSPRLLSASLLLGLLACAGCHANVAQAQGGGSWINEISEGKVFILMVFGAGLVTALGWAVGHVVQVLRADRIEHEDITGLINQLESIDRRLAAIEKAVGLEPASLGATSWAKKDSG
jgi:hypothetical protein